MNDELKLMMYMYEGMIQELDPELQELYQKFKKQATEALENLEGEELQIAAIAYFLTSIKQF